MPKIHMLRLLLIFLLCYCQLAAQNRKPSAAPAPSWITPVSVNYANTIMDGDAEDGYISLDYEKQVSLKEQSMYTRFANRIITEAGVQNKSQVSVSFDPTFQRLTFHSIKIIRGNTVINKLDMSKIKVIQEEDELDNYIYNGSLNAVLFLEDVRKGDIIEGSYSLKGFNPIFGNKYHDIYTVQFASPSYQLYYKLLVPAGRTVTVKNTIDTLSPLITKQAQETMYEWKCSSVPALHTQDRLPSWFEVYPDVMVSEFKSWKEVNEWARTVFPKNISLSPALINYINTIKQADTSVENRILQSLRFVQDDIRYMGMEMGVNSHKPANPAKVFSQRFGDCKEKSYLLCCMLNAMGIVAEPVLINTEYKRSLFNWLPSPGSFDHVTVRVKLNDLWYYFDPTIAYQRGGINDISYPDYQAGLAITDTTTTLSAIPFKPKGQVNTKEVFEIPDMSGKAKLYVITVYTGSFADDVRYDFKSNSNYEMRDTYKKFYANYFEGMHADSLGTKDNDTTGAFTTLEYYTIDSIWSYKNHIKKISFLPYLVQPYLKAPKDKQRTMPFAISFPENYHETILIKLPDYWDAKSSEEDISCSAFKFRTRFSGPGRQLELKYDFESLKDHVLPEETNDFLNSLDKTDGATGYEVTFNENDNKIQDVGTSGSSSPFKAIYTFLLLGVIIFSIVKLTKRR